MKSNYNSLGKYIRVVSERNSNLQNQNLIGLSIEKKFIPSISNTIGTDMSTYRIINTNQFAYSPVTSRNGDKITIALYQGKEEAMISQAYTVFEISDSEKLLPEYLMMWFRRPEFDRYARFKSHGSAREIFEWDSMCAAELPVPHINKQKEIVKEYNTIVNRIKLNEQLCQKLEETAQAIYKHWFVDFEFPNEKGKPYKPNGGEMKFDEELEKEIPKGWIYGKIGGYVKLSQGLVVNATTNHLIKKEGIPLLRITDLINGTSSIFIDACVDKKNIAKKEDIIITRTGQVGLVFRNKEGVIYNNCFKITPIETFLKKDYLFWFLKKESTHNAMIELASGSSAQFDLTHTSFNTLLIMVPSIKMQDHFSQIVLPIENHKELIHKENTKLEVMKNILLSKLATIEN